MGFRYRSSIRLARGLRINLSKSGASLSVGGRGATVNVGKRGIRGTIGLPGTGISYSETAPWHPRDGHQAEQLEPPVGQRSSGRGAAIIVLVLVAIGVAIVVAFVR
jgi:hypothetical protein